MEAVQPPMDSLIYFLPKYLGAWLIVIVAGLAILDARTNVSEKQTPMGSAEPVQVAKTLLVNKGRDECLIGLDRISSLSASKNYVDVRCDGHTYLLRSTLKQIEEILPPGEFVRTHRSHIVRMRAIARVRMLPSGTGFVVLEDGTTMPLSKKHYRSLDQYRSTALLSRSRTAQ
jgi:DNA-binding LytR/AlgR family response regulator